VQVALRDGTPPPSMKLRLQLTRKLEMLPLGPR